MKKIISFFCASFLVACFIAIIASRTSVAEEIASTTDMSRLANVLEKMLVQRKEVIENVQTISYASGIKNPQCLDNYKTWKKSTNYKSTAKWNIDFMPTISTPGSNNNVSYRDYLTDINGDGLTDYIYAFRKGGISQGGFKTNSSCVYLNNGSGFTPVYRCMTADENGTPTFYGDCAG